MMSSQKLWTERKSAGMRRQEHGVQGSKPNGLRLTLLLKHAARRGAGAGAGSCKA